MIYRNIQKEILNGLVYVKGNYSGSIFTATSDEIYIYNNSFTMPNSDIQIICHCVKRTQKATIENNQVALSADTWYPDNMILNSFNLGITDKNFKYHELVDVNSLNYISDWCYKVFNFDYPTPEGHNFKNWENVLNQ